MLSFCETLDPGLQRQKKKKKTLNTLEFIELFIYKTKKDKKKTCSSGEYNKIISFLIN